MITRIELSKKRAGSSYDLKSKKYITYKISVRIGGKRYRQSGFPSQKAAKDYIDALKIKRAYNKAGLRAPVGNVRIEQLLEKRKTAITNKAERARADRIFDYFLDLVNNIPVSEIRSSHFQHFINARLADGVKPETVNREINLLSAAFRRGPEMFPDELEDYEPPRVPRPKFKRKRREVTISESDKTAILEHLYAPQTSETDAAYQNRVRIGRMFHIAYLLGMAYSEVAHLLKTDYDGERLKFIRRKTGNYVVFEWLPDEAHQVFQDAIAVSDTEYIFTVSGSTPKNFYSIMKRAVESAGLTYGRDSGITFHSARHTFVTAAMEHGDIKTVGSMSGHSDDTMVMLYAHASPASRKRTLQAMYAKKDWREIYERIRLGEMSYEEFEKLVR